MLNNIAALFLYLQPLRATNKFFLNLLTYLLSRFRSSHPIFSKNLRQAFSNIFLNNLKKHRNINMYRVYDFDACIEHEVKKYPLRTGGKKYTRNKANLSFPSFLSQAFIFGAQQ